MGLAFDLVQGQTLSAAARDPRMKPELKAAILEQLASILAHVHSHNIVHRDLKPDNVLVTDAFWTAPQTLGGVKLVDFGISVRAGNPSPVTNPGNFMGTTPYLPPDLVCGGLWPLDRQGFARDVFAFGVMGWELLVGTHPTALPHDSHMKAYTDIYRNAYENRLIWPPPSGDGPWMVAIRACLTLDPQQRPANGAAIVDIQRTGRLNPITTTHAHTGPTDVHVAATKPPIPITAAQTPLQMTEAMRTPPVTPPHVYPTPPVQLQGAPVPYVPAPPRQAPAKSANGLLLLMAFVGAAALGAFALWAIAFPKNTLSTDNVARPSEITNTLPIPPQSTLQAQLPEAVPCCIGQGPCASGRTCERGHCDDKALVERTWALRITGVKATEHDEDLTGTHPRATVCMRNDRSGEKICAPMTNIARDGGDRVNVLHATTSDLAYGRVTISVIEGSKMLYPDARMADNREGIKTSVLCRGMRLRAGPRDSAPVHVLVFLD
jgi:eukaryotic-like serine/threonine-protein kinase